MKKTLLFLLVFAAGWYGSQVFQPFLEPPSVEPSQASKEVSMQARKSVFATDTNAFEAEDVSLIITNSAPADQQPETKSQVRTTQNSTKSIQSALAAFDRGNYQSFFKRISGYGESSLQIVRSEFLLRLMTIRERDSVLARRLIANYLKIETYSPVAQLLQAWQLVDNRQLTKGIDKLFQLGSYYQEEVNSALINSELNQWSTAHIDQLSSDGQWQNLLGFYDYLIRQQPATAADSYASYYYAKSQVYHRIKEYDKAIQSLDEVASNSQWESKAESLQQDIMLSIADNSLVKIPLQRLGDQYAIELNVNRGKVKLLIDTGASISTLRPDLARQLTLGRSGQNIRLNTAGGVINAPLLRAEQFGFDGYLVSNIRLAAIDLGSDLPVDGLLGMDYLSAFQFYIDQQNSKLYISAVKP